MILGKGLKVTAKKENIADMVNEFFETINWDEHVIFGAQSSFP